MRIRRDSSCASAENCAFAQSADSQRTDIEGQRRAIDKKQGQEPEKESGRKEKGEVSLLLEDLPPEKVSLGAACSGTLSAEEEAEERERLQTEAEEESREGEDFQLASSQAAFRRKSPPRNGSTEKETVEVLAFSAGIKSRLIGAKGVKVHEVRRESGAKVKIDGSGGKCEVRISGTRDQLKRARAMLTKLAEEADDSFNGPPEEEGSALCHDSLEFPAGAASVIIGPRGRKIREIQVQTGAKVSVEKLEGYCRVSFSGAKEAVERARELVTRLVEEGQERAQQQDREPSVTDRIDFRGLRDIYLRVESKVGESLKSAQNSLQEIREELRELKTILAKERRVNPKKAEAASRGLEPELSGLEDALRAREELKTNLFGLCDRKGRGFLEGEDMKGLAQKMGSVGECKVLKPCEVAPVWGIDRSAFGSFLDNREGRYCEDSLLRRLIEEYRSKGRRGELKDALFRLCDKRDRGLLANKEMKEFARKVGFGGSDSDWKRDYEDICDLSGTSPARGIDLSTFSEFLDNKTERGCYCKDGLLRSLVEAYRKEEENTVSFAGVDPRATEEEVRTLFSGAGKLAELLLFRNKGGRSRGIGQARYSAKKEAEMAITMFAGRWEGGRLLTIKKASPQE